MHSTDIFLISDRGEIFYMLVPQWFPSIVNLNDHVVTVLWQETICIWPGNKYCVIFTSLQSRYWSVSICVCLYTYINLRTIEFYIGAFSVKLSLATLSDPPHMLIEFDEVWPLVGCVNLQVLGLTSAVVSCAILWHELVFCICCNCNCPWLNYEAEINLIVKYIE